MLTHVCSILHRLLYCVLYYIALAAVDEDLEALHPLCQVHPLATQLHEDAALTRARAHTNTHTHTHAQLHEDAALTPPPHPPARAHTHTQLHEDAALSVRLAHMY